MTTKVRYLGVAVLAIGLALLAACGSNDKTPSAGGKTPVPTSTTHSENEWTIVTPAGWSSENITPSADAKKAIRYRSAAGDYVIVAIDPLGSGYSYDTLWQYEVRGSGFEIVKRTECSAGDESCSTKDNRFDGYALWKTGAQPPKVGGHTWYFVFGNTAKTSVDAAAYEEIIESIRVSG